MSATSPTTAVPAPADPPVPLDDAPAAPRQWRLAAHHLALAAVLALSAVLNVNRLSQNGYANIFYSAGVKSMLHSLHNFVFVSFDPGGLITVDKPPIGLWVQATSARLFGLSPLSLLLPEAIAGVLSVAALYWVLVRRFGRTAALIGALALAVFPSFVAVSRDNNLDAVLILLMIIACGLALRAIETGRWRTLIGCAVIVGLAFNTKTLAAYLVVPGIAVGYLVCAPGSPPRRLLKLLVAGAVMLAVSASWVGLVELTPASQRPFVGGSTDNTELGLTFGYNGLGRVGGQVGGPGEIPRGAGAQALIVTHPARTSRPAPRGGPRPPARRAPVRRAPLSPLLPNGRDRNPVAFGGPPSPTRLFGVGLGSQGGWMLPFAFAGMLLLALLALTDMRSGAGDGRRDRRLAGLLVLGGWFLVEAAVLSLSKGIVHPYYISALGPGTAAMIGAGAAAFIELGRARDRRLILLPLAVGATVAAQIALLHRDDYMHWLPPVLIAGSAVGVIALLAVRRAAVPAMALTLGVLLIAPTVYAADTWGIPVEGTFPAAGPRAAGGIGQFGVSSHSMRVNRSLLTYIRQHHPGSRWALLTVASDTAAPFILLGLPSGAVAGYSGTDPALDGPGLARLVAKGQARYVVLGGAYSSRGGNRATAAVLRACVEVPAGAWFGAAYTRYSLVLFDCAGRERQLAAS